MKLLFANGHEERKMKNVLYAASVATRTTSYTFTPANYLEILLPISILLQHLRASQDSSYALEVYTQSPTPFGSY
jgi:hypothetical protein